MTGSCQVLQVLLHALLIVQEPPGGTPLHLAPGLFALEAANEGHQFHVHLGMEVEHDGLGQGAFGVEPVKQPGQVLDAVVLADAVIAGIQADGLTHDGVVVAHGTNVQLRHQRVLGIELEQEIGEVTLERILLLLGEGLPIQTLGVNGLSLFTAGHGAHPLHSDIAGLGPMSDESSQTLPDLLLQHVQGGNVSQLAYEGQVVFVLDVHDLVRAESGGHLELIPLLSDFLKDLQIIEGLVGGEYMGHVGALDHLLGGELMLLNVAVAALPDLLSVSFVDLQVAVEEGFQLQLGPVIQGVAESGAQHLAVGKELFLVGSVAGDQFLFHAVIA
ncbi:unknown [Clostridium sp. CAG:1013]|nr:unknown [Clostridium sp. CAG:1013]